MRWGGGRDWRVVAHGKPETGQLSVFIAALWVSPGTCHNLHEHTR